MDIGRLFFKFLNIFKMNINKFKKIFPISDKFIERKEISFFVYLISLTIKFSESNLEIEILEAKILFLNDIFDKLSL